MIEKYIKDFRDKGIASIANMSEDEQKQIVKWAQDLVDQYGSILKENPMKISNAADLPCPKENLKIAIKILIPAYIVKGPEDTVSLLKDRYVCLSIFQEISEEDKETIIKEINKIDRNSGLKDTSFFPTYNKYMQIVISEQKILLEDINTFIGDL
jgi:hypothetical protein